MVASVVVLPLPVGPVMTIMPCGRARSLRIIDFVAASSSPSLASSSRPRSRGNKRTTALSPCCVGMVATRTSISDAADAQPRGAVLRQPPLGDVEAGEDLDARNQRLRHHAGRRRNGAQQPVDPHAHGEPGAERLDMDVAGAQLHRALEQIVEGAHHRRAARKIAQAVDIVVAVSCLRRPRTPSASPPSSRSSTVVMSSNEAMTSLDAVAEHDFCGPDRGGIGRIGDRQLDAAVGRPEREHHGLRAESAGKSPRRWASLASSSSRLIRGKIPESGHLVGKFGGRQIGGFPQFAQSLDRRIGLTGVHTRAPPGNEYFSRRWAPNVSRDTPCMDTHAAVGRAGTL